MDPGNCEICGKKAVFVLSRRWDQTHLGKLEEWRDMQAPEHHRCVDHLGSARAFDMEQLIAIRESQMEKEQCT